MLHPLFSDHMVFPRDVEAPVWGWTMPFGSVTVSFAGRTAQADADDQGRWKAVLGPFPASAEPQVMTVTAAGDERTIRDVLVGDVWLCSGQSNMEWPVSKSADAEKELAAANHPGLRLFTVPKKIAFAPQEHFESAWQPCTSETVAGFSAVAYYFGRDIHQSEKVPVGLINSSWGGTVAEAWVSPEALDPLEDFDPILAELRRLRTQSAAQEEEEFWKKVGEWTERHDPAAQAGENWAAPGFDDSKWQSIRVPGQWQQGPIGDYHGIVWFRRSLQLPEGWDKGPAVLDLGVTDEIDTTWINGIQLKGPPLVRSRRVYPVPRGVLRPGPNTVAVRISDTQGGSGILPTQNGLLLIPDEPIGSRSVVDLSGEWKVRAGVPLRQMAPFPLRLSRNPNVPTVLYNGMIAPLTPFALKGSLWYQGESNVGRAGQYQRLLPALIGDWRQRFTGGEFPFLIVQLANFHPRPATPSPRSDWAELREAQALTARRTPHTGLAVTIDIGEAGDIHPRNKQDVGRRLAMEARHLAYGKEAPRSPRMSSVKIEGSSARVTFEHCEEGLVTQGGDEVKGFTVVDGAGGLHWAHGRVEGCDVVVSAPGVEQIAAVRYGWETNPEVSLYNKAGLPAVPFRSEAPAEEAAPR